MSPPERTFGPIGWKGLFGDDEESEDDASTRDEGSAAADRPPAEDERPSTGPERSPSDAGAGPTSRSETEDAIREERSRRARDFAEAKERSSLTEGDQRRADDEDPLDGWTTLDELPEGDSRDADRSSTASGAGGATEQDTSRSGAETDTVAPEWTGAADGPDGSAVSRPDAGGATGGDSGDRSDREAGEGSDGRTDTGTRSETSDAEPPPSEPRVRTERAEVAADESEHGTAGESRRATDDEQRDRAIASRDTRERRSQEGADTPPSRPRVRTARSDTEPEPESSSERTFGPIGLKWLSGDEGDEAELRARAEESRTRTDAAAPATADQKARTTAVVERDRTRAPARHTATEAEETGLADRVPGWVSFTAIGVGVGLLVFLDIVSMMVPLIAFIGAGIVGGFVAGYIAGGTVRGAAHALAVGIIGGISVGYLTALIGALIGLFLEPATLLGNMVGPIAPDLGMFGAWGPLLVMVFVTAMVAIDATIGGVVGGTVRTMVDEVR